MEPSKRYKQITEFHLSNKTLFEDPEFPPCAISIDPDTYDCELGVEWLRPGEIFEKPVMVFGGASADVSAGELGDDNVAAALCSLVEDEENFARVCPLTQNFKPKNYCGAFRFNFWQFGKWTEVIIDDRLPTKSGNLVFSKSSENGEVWPCLVEKAYAKLFNNYESLKGARLGELLVDLTGGILEVIDVKSADLTLLETKIASAVGKNMLVFSKVAPYPESQDTEAGDDLNGIVRGRAYSVIFTTTVTHEGKEHHLIRLHNPVDDMLEWQGDWGDSSELWKTVDPEMKKTLGVGEDSDDGEFWMSFDDFAKTFDQVSFCNNRIAPDCLSEFQGSWVQGLSAGGCLEKNPETFGRNPQYRIIIKDCEQDGLCSVTISLMLKTLRGFANSPLAIGFSIYPFADDADDYIESGCRLSNDYFVDHEVIDQSNSGKFVNLREVSTTVRLEPGEYCIVPSTEESNKKGDFYLRVVTDFPSNHTENVELKADLKMKGGRTKPMSDYANESKAEIRQLKMDFDELAGADGVISAEELLPLLVEMNKNVSDEQPDMSHAHVLMALFDADGSGHLDFQEFLNMNRYFKKLVRIFQNNCSDKEHGNMTALELEKSLFDLKISIPRKVLGATIERYGDSEKNEVSFVDFLTIVTKFKILMGACQEDQTGEKLIVAGLTM